MVKSVVKSFLPKHTAAEKRGNARKTEILRAFGSRLMRRSHAPKPPALSTAPRPDVLNYTTNDLFLQVVKSVVKSFLPDMKAAEKRGNARKTEISRAFGGWLTRRSHAPKCRALPAAPLPDKIFIFLKMQYRNKFVVKVEELSSMRFIRYCLYYSKIGGKCQLRKGNNVDLIQFTYKYRIYLFVI